MNNNEYISNIVHDPTPVYLTQRYRNSVSIKAEESFKLWIKEHGFTLIDDEYKGSKYRHDAICNNGHLTSVQPNAVSQGQNGCIECYYINRPITIRMVNAEIKFRNSLDNAGAVLIESRYIDVKTPHRIKCINGHYTEIRPANLLNGQGVCRYCARGSDIVFTRFKQRLYELGAVLQINDNEWKGSDNPYYCICANEHDCYPIANDTLRGIGICRICAWENIDCFYILTSITGLKFGITGTPTKRLNVHIHDGGYRNQIKLLTNLPSMHAAELEQRIIRYLKSQNIKPIRGREYFDISVLPIVIQLVKEYEKCPQD